MLSPLFHCLKVCIRTLELWIASPLPYHQANTACYREANLRTWIVNIRCSVFRSIEKVHSILLRSSIVAEKALIWTLEHWIVSWLHTNEQAILARENQIKALELCMLDVQFLVSWKSTFNITKFFLLLLTKSAFESLYFWSLVDCHTTELTLLAIEANWSTQTVHVTCSIFRSV